MSSLAPEIGLGSRWQLIRGQHAGSIVEVQGVTAGGSVKYRNVEGGAKTGSSPEDDDGRIHTRKQAEFLTLYEPAHHINGHTVVTQPAFRQHNVRSAPAEAGTPLPPAQGLSVTLMTITPALAQEWLNRGGLNRHLASFRVGKLAAAIRRGEWQITGDTIKLDADGRVRDGQHRLQAIADAGIDVQTLVVRNVEEPAFDVMDTGKNRTLPDVLGIHGYKYVNGLAGAVRNLILWEHTGRLVVTGASSAELVNSVTVLAYLDRHPDVQETMLVADAVRYVLSGGISLWAALFVLFQRVDRDAAMDFEYRLLNGEDLRRGDPILMLRNNLLSGKAQPFITRDANDKEILAAAIIKAWNAHRRKERIESWSQLQWKQVGRSAQAFPRPDD